MDTASATIGIILILLFTVPIIAMIYKQKTKDGQRLKNLLKIGAENNLHLDHHELSNSLLLGLDYTLKKLVIVDSKTQKDFEIVDLRNLRTVVLSQETNPELKTGSGKIPITHVKLDLLKNSREKKSEIVFYDEDSEYSYDVETQLFLANKWMELIKKSLPPKQALSA